MKNPKNDTAAYVMILPAYLIFSLFVLVPVLGVIYYSLTKYNMYTAPQFIGFKNFTRMFTDSDFLHSIRNTLFYSFFYLVPQMLLGLLLAVLLNRGSRLVTAYRTAIYIPNVMSMVCASMVWLWIFNPTFGLLNIILGKIGIGPNQWLLDPAQSMICIVGMSIWKGCGYSMVVYLSGLTGIPKSLYEAARIDGAGEIKQFFAITWPMLQPTTFFLLITGIVNSFSVFEQVNIMTNGGPLNSTTTIVHQIFRRGFLEYKMGYASSMAVLLLMFSLGITMLVFKFGNKGQDTDVS
jgi:multiple sugar transport system permease protein/raffinose/stachyose/melibiose transport system permease protein